MCDSGYVSQSGVCMPFVITQQNTATTTAVPPVVNTGKIGSDFSNPLFPSGVVPC